MFACSCYHSAMCGLTGFWGDMPGLSREVSGAAHAQEMGRALSHRGPDARGVWSDESLRYAVAHERLSVQDLSDAGAQPMTSPSGRYVLAFNGEIYNHLTLRETLADGSAAQGYAGHSDTETLVACFDAWGVEATLVRAIGMFAMAVWDRERRQLLLVRDRLGIKPLYWANLGASTWFGSEIGALPPDSHDRSIDRASLGDFLRLGYVPSPHAIYEGVHKVEPGAANGSAFSSKHRGARFTKGIPIDRWMTHELRDWVESLISEKALRSDGLLDVGAVRALWREHQQGTRRHHHVLWNLCMFQAWRKEAAQRRPSEKATKTMKDEAR